MATIGYKLTHDAGFAPNPFHGFLTLATCKPVIRRCRVKYDWVAGFASITLANLAKSKGVFIDPHALVYLMQITEEPIRLLSYFEDPRFVKKKPDLFSSKQVDRCGDNIYYAVGASIHQLPNDHHTDDEVGHDLGGLNAIVSNNFYYFGQNAFMPDEGWTAFLGQELSKARTFMCPPILVPRLLERFRQQRIQKGLNGTPCLWPMDEEIPKFGTEKAGRSSSGCAGSPTKLIADRPCR